jgi:uridine kinase
MHSQVPDSSDSALPISLRRVADTIVGKHRALGGQRAVLVGISGIDASGKGFVAAKLARELEKRAWNVAVINVDDWLNLPPIRFNPRDPAAHFYEHAIRFNDTFEQLVLPLRDTRGANVKSDVATETATAFRKHHYEFHNIDVVILEGIFLFKSAYRHLFDVKIWIDCSFATALQRAITRCQENLPPRQTKLVFETIYFAAQQIHRDRDDPRGAADIILANDKL